MVELDELSPERGSLVTFLSINVDLSLLCLEKSSVPATYMRRNGNGKRIKSCLFLTNYERTNYICLM